LGLFLVYYSEENSEENRPPKNVGKNWNFPQKKFRKIVFPGNSEENSAESDFLRKKCTKNDDGTVQRVIVSASGNDVGGFDPPPPPPGCKEVDNIFIYFIYFNIFMTKFASLLFGL
jgi:hypothetical protein